MQALRFLYEKKELTVKQVVEVFDNYEKDSANAGELAEMSKGLNFKHTLADSEEKCIFGDWAEANNKINFTKGFVALTGGYDEAVVIAYKALSMILAKFPTGKTGEMQTFTYKRKKFWVKLEGDYIVFLLPTEY